MIDEEIVRKIQEMGREGVSVSSIGRQFGLSRFTVRKYLEDESNHHETEKAHSFIPKKKAAFVLNRTSETHPIHPRVAEAKANADVIHYRVQEEREKQELEKVVGPKEHPALVEKRARVEIVNLDLDEYEAQKKLEARKKEEMQKAQVEEEARIAKEIEQEQLTEKQKRLTEREKWVRGWQDWALSREIPRGVSIPADIKFRIKDAVAKALMNRSEQENRGDIEELIKITTQSILQPLLDKVRVEKKIQLIETWAFPQIDTYIKGQGLEGYLNEEGKGKIREDVKNHFMKVLTGTESFIFSFQVTDVLNIFLKPVKESKAETERKAREARVERIKKERERVEGEEKAFWDTVKERRRKEEIESLVQAGMNRFNYYLLANRKELGVIDAKEQERARRHLERELREEVEGNETDEEVEKIVDGILDNFFFE
jgi:predicted transcriptional regulator